MTDPGPWSPGVLLLPRRNPQRLGVPLSNPGVGPGPASQSSPHRSDPPRPVGAMGALGEHQIRTLILFPKLFMQI